MEKLTRTISSVKRANGVVGRVGVEPTLKGL
jgi:hypothetical protein